MFGGLRSSELLLAAAIALLLWGVSRLGGGTAYTTAAKTGPRARAAARSYLDRLFGASRPRASTEIRP